MSLVKKRGVGQKALPYVGASFLEQFKQGIKNFNGTKYF